MLFWNFCDPLKGRWLKLLSWRPSPVYYFFALRAALGFGDALAFMLLGAFALGVFRLVGDIIGDAFTLAFLGLFRGFGLAAAEAFHVVSLINLQSEWDREVV